MHLISLAYRIFFVICTRFENVAFFLNIFNKGEMLEWLKRHAWKACKRQKCFAGSNPALSAVVMENVKAGKQLKQINNN